jgi:aspartate aminotransferase
MQAYRGAVTAQLSVAWQPWGIFRTLAALHFNERNTPLAVSLSKRVQKVKPSPTLAVTARAAKLKAEGKDIIGLGAGEPDFDTPLHIADAGVEAIRKGLTRYTAVDGTAELKDAIIAKFKRDNHLTYERSQVLVSSGAKQTCFNLCAAVLDPGDECVIPAPYWVSYPDMALLADAEPVSVYAGPEQGYKITPAQLDAALTPRSKLFFINSPSNPTGAAYTRAELQALGAVLDKYPQVIIASDEMYEHIYWAPEPFTSFLQANPQLYDRTVTINGLSKAYAMTGWRIGYCGGPKEIVAAMSTIQGQSTSNASSISQRASTVALNSDQACVADMNRAFKARHDFVVTGLNAIPGISCLPGAGTFYAFADVTGAMRALGIKDDTAFAEYLLVQAGVAVVPGSGFGAPNHMRLSFACSMETLHDALGRISKVVSPPVAKSA